ncbi:YDG domain-containing protein, partial [Noviherbaspirillum galbum]
MSGHATVNRIYRLVWSRLLGAWVAVAEIARAKGKSSGGRSLRLAVLIGAGAALPAHAAGPAPDALPAGGQAIAGQVAGIVRNGATLTINQASERAIIEWASFNVGAQAQVNFNQPSTGAATLNRVLDTQASQIFGRITAPGQVFLANPNGIYFSPGASVDVGGLVATTHSIANGDFMAGNLKFTRNGATASVVNEGQLKAALGGYIALLAPEVRNSGVIIAQAGTIALASGEAITLKMGESRNLTGIVVEPSAIKALVENSQAVLAPGGLVVLSAKAADRLLGGVIRNTGAIEATGLTSDGGRIVLEASDQIVAGGSFKADAAAGSAGKGGNISIVADLSNPGSRTEFSGAASARGGEKGGDGGFVETSASRLKVAGARVDTRAPAGKDGTWLLDPNDYKIDSAANNGDITGADLGASLETTNVTISSSNGAAAGNGDISVNEAVTWNSARTLTLNAVRHVNVNEAVTAGSGTANLRADANGACVTGATNCGTVNFSGNGHVTAAATNIYSNPPGSNAATPSYATPTDYSPYVTGPLTAYMLVNDVTQLQAINDNFQSSAEYGPSKSFDGKYIVGNYALGRDIDASATAGWNGGAGFRSIGTHNFWGSDEFDWAYAGKFDGLGHAITNLTINQPGRDYVGLFGMISGTVSNLTLVNPNVTGHNQVGALAGAFADNVNWSQQPNSFATGRATNVAVVNGNVAGITSVGGLAGLIDSGSTLSNVAAVGGNVQGQQNVGGVVGDIRGASSGVSNAFNTSTVTGIYSGGTISIGGVVGYSQGVISDVFNRGYVTSSGDYAYYTGGVVGFADTGSTTANSYSSAAISHTATTNGGDFAGPALGYPYGQIGTVSNVYFNTDRTSLPAMFSGAQGFDTAGMRTASNLTGLNFNGTWKIDPIRNNGYPYLAALESFTPLTVTPTALTVKVTGSATSSVYGDTLATFGYTLVNGSTELTAGALSGMGLIAGGTASYSGAPTGRANVGTYTVDYSSGIVFGGANAENYTINGSTPFSYSVTPKSLIAVLTVANKTYDGTTSATVNGVSLSGVLSGDTVTATIAGSASFADKNAANGKTVSATGASIGGASAGNYVLSGTTATGTANITPKLLTISGVTGVDKVYDGTDAATVTGTAVLNGIVAGDDISYTIADPRFFSANAGARAIVYNGAGFWGPDGGNYMMSMAANTLAYISPKPLAVSGVSALNKVYDGTTTAALTGGTLTGVIGGDAVSYSPSTGTFASKNVGAGISVAISGGTLSGAAAGNYSIASVNSSTADITPKPLTVTGVSASNKTYDGTTNATVSGGALSGVVSGDTVTLSLGSGSFADKTVGSGKTVTISGNALGGTDAGNYTVQNATATANINFKLLSIGGVTGVDKVYDGTDAATVTGTPVLNGIVAGDDISYSFGSPTFASANAGLRSIVYNYAGFSGADGGNYLISVSGNTSASITPKPLTVSGVTALNKVYDGTTTAALSGGVLSGVVGGDAVSYSPSTGTFANKNVGAGISVAISGGTLSGAAAANYSIASVNSSTADITPKPLTVTGVSASNKTYDGTTNATVSDGALSGVVSGDTVTLSLGSGSFADKTVGSGKTVTISGNALGGTDAGNYTVQNATATANINFKLLSIGGVTGVDKVYDGTDAATVTGTAVLNGIVAGDDISYSFGSPTFASANAGLRSIVYNYAGFSGADGGNYLISVSGNTSANITPKPLTVSGVTALNKVYDGTTTAALTGGALSGVIGGDAVSYSPSTGTFASKNVGTGISVAISGGTLSGAAAANYSIASVNSSTADITPKPLTVTGVSASNKTYDGTTNAAVSDGALSGVVSGDTVTLSLGSGSFADKTVGSGKTVTISGNALGGT